MYYELPISAERIAELAEPLSDEGRVFLARILEVSLLPETFKPEPEEVMEGFENLTQADKDQLRRISTELGEAFGRLVDESRGMVSLGEQVASLIERAQAIEPGVTTLGEAIELLESRGIKPGVSPEILEMPAEVPVAAIQERATLVEVLRRFSRNQRRIVLLYYAVAEDLQKLLEDAFELDDAQAARVLERYRVREGISEERWNGELRKVDWRLAQDLEGKSFAEFVATLDPERQELYRFLTEAPDAEDLSEEEVRDLVLSPSDEQVREVLEAYRHMKLKELFKSFSKPRWLVWRWRCGVLEEAGEEFDKLALAREVAALPEAECEEMVREALEEIREEYVAEQVQKGVFRREVGEDGEERIFINEEHPENIRQEAELQKKVVALSPERRRIFEALQDERRTENGEWLNRHASMWVVERLSDAEVAELQPRLRRIRRGLELGR